METEWTQTLGAGPLLLIAAAAIAVLLLLIIKFRVHAFLALVTVSVVTAFATGIPAENVIPTLTEGFGSTLASVALLVGLGAMLGRLVEVSGGAQSLTDALLRRFGEKRAPFALGVASMIFGFPIFFDAGFVVMLPIIFAVARRLGGSVLLYALPAAGAFSIMHIYLPPHPARSPPAPCSGPTSAWSSPSGSWSRSPPGTSPVTCTACGPAGSSTCPSPRSSAAAPRPSARRTRRRPPRSSASCCCRWS
ncbi:hypothetical protein GCM10029992_55590 [Glycomyces albus]